MEKQDDRSSSPKEISIAVLTRLIMPIILIIAVIAVLYLAKDTAYSGRDMPLSGLMETIVGYVVFGCEAASVFVIATSAIHGIFAYVKRLFNKDYMVQIRSSESIRLHIGQRLSLALEFAMAADILSLAVSPHFNDLLTLFIIILLRGLITIFLEFDIETSAHRHKLIGTDWLNLFPEDEVRKNDRE